VTPSALQAIVERFESDAYYTAIFRELLTYMMGIRETSSARRVCNRLQSTSNASPIMQRTSPKWSSSWCRVKDIRHVASSKPHGKQAANPTPAVLSSRRKEDSTPRFATSSVNEAGLSTRR